MPRKTYDHSEFSLPAHTTQELVRYAAAGQEDALRHFSSMGEYLGIGVTNLINSFNPELIVIGGALSEAEAWLGSLFAGLSRSVRFLIISSSSRLPSPSWAAGAR